MAQVMHGAMAPELDWELLYDVHAPKLRRVIQRRVGSALADDVLQETFLRAFKNRAGLDPTRPVEPWLMTIAMRTATDVQRRQLRTIETVEEMSAEADELALDALEEELLSRARRMGIKHAFASLNTRQRRLLQLVTLEGMSYEGVADAEDMTADAVKSALARARTNFKTSYMGFERESGLFGGAAIVGLLTRLRDRLHRYQAFVGEHMTGVGAAAATVAVVAVASVPAARQAPSSATERLQSTVGSAPAQNFTDSQIGAVSSSNTQWPVAPTARSDSGSQGGAQLRTQTNATAGSNGSRFSTTTRSDVSTGAGDAHDGTEVNTQCNAGRMGRAMCDVAELLPGVAPPG